MKHYRLSLCIVAYLFSLTIQAQVTPPSQMENLSRGVIAMPAQSGQGIYVSWRLLGTDPTATTSFDLLRDGTTIASNLGFQTNFTDAEGTSASKYQVVTRRNGEIVETTPEVSPQNQVYRVLQLDRPANGVDDITHEPYDYTPNDCSVGDVDGDGQMEIVVKRLLTVYDANGNITATSEGAADTDPLARHQHPGRKPAYTTARLRLRQRREGGNHPPHRPRHQGRTRTLCEPGRR